MQIHTFIDFWNRITVSVLLFGVTISNSLQMSEENERALQDRKVAAEDRQEAKQERMFAQNERDSIFYINNGQLIFDQ